VMEHLQRRGARVTYHDPYVPMVGTGDQGLQCTELSHGAIADADCVALLTPHSSYDLTWIADAAQLVFDAQNAFGPDPRTNVERL
ncbi:MAG: UDP binding domain-containing protein, partial [Actinomycetota bacterium]